jgi:hypothetical protein
MAAVSYTSFVIHDILVSCELPRPTESDALPDVDILLQLLDTIEA